VADLFVVLPNGGLPSAANDKLVTASAAVLRTTAAAAS
jgi:hypothetical protein